MRVRLYVTATYTKILYYRQNTVDNTVRHFQLKGSKDHYQEVHIFLLHI
jgi:hypothetical protein